MTYTIKEASDITGIPATTLRYYDKEGILPFLERNPATECFPNRIFPCCALSNV
jgi:predicted site-specific integrase-resolvase